MVQFQQEGFGRGEEERGCQIRREQGRDGDGEKKNTRHHLELRTPRTARLLETVRSSGCNFHLRHGAFVCTHFTTSSVGWGEFIPLSLKKKSLKQMSFYFYWFIFSLSYISLSISPLSLKGMNSLMTWLLK